MTRRHIIPNITVFIVFSSAVAGAFEMKTTVVDASPPERPYTKIAADFNGDGLPDAAIGGARGPLFWYAAPDWQKRHIVDGGYDTVDGEAADIDGDGDLDIVMGGTLWYENPGPAEIADADAWAAHRIAKQSMHDVEVGDLDGDGKLDVATRDQSAFGGPTGNRIYLYLQRDEGAWEAHGFECPQGEGIKLADLDRDGDLDVVVPARWYENTGNAAGEWPEHVYADKWDFIDAEVQCADFNQDGRADIVLTPAEKAGGSYRIAWFEAPQDAKEVWPEHIIEAETEAVVHALAVGDMDGDGVPDVAAAEMHQGADPDEVRVYLNKNKGGVWEKQVVSEKGSHDIVVADFGNDGDLDILGANHAGSIQAVHLWENLAKD